MDKKELSYNLEDLLNVSKMEAAKELSSNIMKMLVEHLEKTYGPPTHVPKEVFEVVSIVNNVAQSIANTYDNMVKEKSKGNFSIEGIKVTVPEENVIK
jgi:hypothetical protein